MPVGMALHMLMQSSHHTNLLHVHEVM
jgi:hypothetical protein